MAPIFFILTADSYFEITFTFRYKIKTYHFSYCRYRNNDFITSGIGTFFLLSPSGVKIGGRQWETVGIGIKVNILRLLLSTKIIHIRICKASFSTG